MQRGAKKGPKKGEDWCTLPFSSTADIHPAFYQLWNRQSHQKENSGPRRFSSCAIEALSVWRRGRPVHILRGALFGGTVSLFWGPRSSFSRRIPTTRSSGKRGLLNIPREKRQCCPTLVSVCVCVWRAAFCVRPSQNKPAEISLCSQRSAGKVLSENSSPPGVSEDKHERLMDRWL